MSPADLVIASKPMPLPPLPADLVIVNILVSLAFVAAIFITIISYIFLRKYHFYLTEHMGKGQWDFSKSWATNITIFGSLVCTIIAQDTVNKLVYAGLSVFFGVLVVISPMVYNATSQPRMKHSTTGDEEIQHLSPIWAFLISAALTLWAVLGQLAVVITLLIIALLPNSVVLQHPYWSGYFALINYVIIVFMVLATALVGVYAYKTILWTVREQVSPEAKNYRRKALYETILKNTNNTAGIISQHELQPEHPAVPWL
jgi:hypothetical protein